MATIEAQIRIRRDTAANFTSANPTLALGEIAYETDTRNLKVGDGATVWTALPYINPYRGNAVAPTSNTVLGDNAGVSLQAGAIRNTLIGQNAGDALTTGDDSVAVGWQALTSASTSNGNVAVGSSAAAATTGVNNTAIGYVALESNVTGGGSVAIGSAAMRNFNPTTSDSNNTAVGSSALNALTTGFNHTAVGQSACAAITTASGTTGVGTFALLRNLAADNSAVGQSALQNNTLGTQNVALGRSALLAATTQAATVTISAAGTGGTPGTYSAVQLTYVSGPTANTYPTADIVVGAGGTVTSVTIVSGGNAFTATSGTVMTAATGSIGNTAGFTCTLATVSTATGNTAIGHQTGLALTTGIRNTFIGALAADAALTANDSVAVGNNAAGALTTSGDVVAIGSSALASGSISIAQTTAVGSASLSAATTSNFATSVGALALINATTATNMVAVGNAAGRYIGTGTTNCTNATNSVLIGQDARPLGDSQANQIVIGYQGRGNGSNTTTIGNGSTTGTFIPAGDLTLTNGNFIVGTSGNGISFAATSDPTIPAVAATGTITRTATNVSNNDTVTIGTTVYTFKTTLTPADYEVLIGADAAASLTNLANAINGTGGTPGTDYQVPAAHPTVTASAIVGSTLPLVAITTGTAGNSIALAETSAQLSVSGATLLGGRAAGAVDSEILSDYEQGTWTPGFTFVTPGNLAVPYTFRNGYYIKVGRMVTVWGEMRTASSGIIYSTASGGARVTGLPYAGGSSLGGISVYPNSGFAYFSGIDMTGYLQASISQSGGDTSLRMHLSRGLLSAVDVGATQIPSGTALSFNFCVTYPSA